MKKTPILFLILFSLTFFFSCSDDGIKIHEPTVDVYESCKSVDGAKEIIKFYVKAVNQKGFMSVALPGAEPITIPNEKVEEMLHVYLSQNEETQKALLKLQTIALWSDRNLVITYDNKVIPDMLSEDGTYVKTLKARKTFDKLYLRISESLSHFIGFPLFGEFLPNLAVSHQTTEDGRWLLFLNYTTLNEIVTNYAAGLGVDAATITFLKNIIGQYKVTGDVLEIGLYFKKIN